MKRNRERELLFSVTRKDFVIQTFRSGGPGGQHQNKTDSGVRIRHPESGAVGEARDNRSQHVNRRMAFRRLVDSPEFRTWLRRKAAEAMTDKRALMRRVEEQMRPENVRVEAMQNGRWVKE